MKVHSVTINGTELSPYAYTSLRAISREYGVCYNSMIQFKKRELKNKAGQIIKIRTFEVKRYTQRFGKRRGLRVVFA